MTTSAMMTMMTTERRRFRPGFRLRVLGSFAALLVAAAVVGLFVQRAVLLRSLDREVDTALEQERAELQTLATGNDPETGEPFAGDVRAIFDTFLVRNVPEAGEVYLAFVDGAPYRATPGPLRLDAVPELASRWGSLTAGERGVVSTDAGPVQFLAVPLAEDGESKGVFVIANFVRNERNEIESAFRIEAAVSVVVLLVATVIAWFVAGRLLRPVRELTEAAESISDSDLTRRIPVEGDDEISRLSETFNAMLDRLERAFAVQRAFVDDAGHELRTPITIVRGHLELMGDDPEDRRETMAVVNDELDRMARIVDDMLVLAKSDQPDFVRPEPVEVADLTTELLVKARALGPRAWKLDACAEGPMRVDPQRITQAMLNLARNAVEHTVAGADIGIGSAWDPDGLRLWVRDTGTGIDAAERDRIFERFARGRSGRRSEGAGLGLAIVRSVATGHGGHVDLDSEVGRGSTFTLFLPGPPPTPPDAPLPVRRPDDATLENPVVERSPSWPGS
jgi:two-component system OmpR family sensor kinase